MGAQIEQAMNSDSPSNTVTFLFTDVEESTRLWERYPQAMKASLAMHDAILRAAIESNHGHLIKTTGDGVHAGFSNALDAVNAVISAQRQLQAPLGDLHLMVRMALYTGEAEMRAGDYYGTVLNRAARLMSVAHGGQILISNATAELLRDQLPEDASLVDLGEHHLKDLSRPEHVYQLSHPALPDEFPPIQSIDSYPNNLPIQLTSFVGRENEIAEIKNLLNSARLVTLTGSGGTGKTRLSLEVGRQELGFFENGVWLVELAPLSDPNQIIPALAQTFGLHELPQEPLDELVVDYLRDKQILLLLDNCEHLIEACARLVNDLLHQCVHLKVITSSRETLGIAGEIAYRIPSLVEAESVRLFIERARAANPKFNLTDASAAAIAQICARLDGIPLAIELAAVRTKLLAPEQILARLGDRFRLLVGGSRTALPRQQTLRALIDWSYDLLSEEEKRLLRSASVFVGGWTLNAIEFVAHDPDVVEHLEQLVNKSMVVAEERESEMRYFLLETLRQYAREKLFDAGEAPAARDRHFLYFDELSEKMWDGFRRSDNLTWRDTADDEVDNFRSALDWGLDNDVEKALHLAANFGIILGWMSNQKEGMGLVQTAIERTRALPPLEGSGAIERQKLIARGLFTQGMIGLGVGDLPYVVQTLREAIAISRTTGDRLMLGYSLEMLFTASTFLDIPDGAEAVKEGFNLFTEEINDQWGLSMAYQSMARYAARKGNLNDKLKYFAKLKELMQDAPVSFQSGLFFLGMGLEESLEKNYETAKFYFEEGLVIFRRLRTRNFQLVIMSELGHIARHTGDSEKARKIYRDTLRGWQDLGNRSASAHQLECFGFLAIAGDEPQRAAQLFGAAESLREKIGIPMTEPERVEYNQAVGQLRSILNEAELDTCWTKGRLMTMEAAVQFALD